MGPDITPGRTLVHEVGLESSPAVSFDKGCYLGQETVARVQYRGQVNRALRLLALDGPTPAGADVTHGEKVVGAIGTPAEHPLLGHIALALLRRDVTTTDHLAVGGVGARVRDDVGTRPA